MGFNLEEKIAAWRSKTAKTHDNSADPTSSMAPVAAGGGSGGGSGGDLGGEDDGVLSRVEFTRTHTAVVDIS